MSRRGERLLHVLQTNPLLFGTWKQDPKKTLFA
jgi:hypothetical protein